MLSRFERFSVSISELYRHLHKISADEMAKYGLKGPYAIYLLTMHRYSEGITATQLCELCDKDKAAVSRALAELERRALVTREAVNDTAYRALVKLTEEGKSAARYVCDKVRSAVELAGKGLNEQDRLAFYVNLRRIADNLRKISEIGLPEPDMT